VQSDHEFAHRGQRPQILGEFGRGDQRRLDYMLLVSVELAIHIVTQECVVATAHIIQLWEKGKRSLVRSASGLEAPRKSGVNVRALKVIRAGPAVRDQPGCEGDHEVHSGRDADDSEPFPPEY
jgi:hypothetical protein